MTGLPVVFLGLLNSGRFRWQFYHQSKKVIATVIGLSDFQYLAFCLPRYDCLEASVESPSYLLLDWLKPHYKPNCYFEWIGSKLLNNCLDTCCNRSWIFEQVKTWYNIIKEKNIIQSSRNLHHLHRPCRHTK